jgi:hypothetical protein
LLDLSGFSSRVQIYHHTTLCRGEIPVYEDREEGNRIINIWVDCLGANECALRIRRRREHHFHPQLPGRNCIISWESKQVFLSRARFQLVVSGNATNNAQAQRASIDDFFNSSGSLCVCGVDDERSASMMANNSPPFF